MSNPKPPPLGHSDDDEPAALAELRRELQALQEAGGAADPGPGEALDVLAARLSALKQEPTVDRDAIWARIEGELESQR